MKVLVTGGAGFIGSHLVEALLQRHYEVRVLDNLSSGKLRNLAAVSKKIQFIRGDICNKKILAKAVRGVQVVYHQAALRSVPESLDHPEAYEKVNVGGMVLMLEACRKAKVRRLVYASSSSVYGEAPLPQKETMTAGPLSPYAASKLAGEMFCAAYSRLYQLSTVGLRYFNVFGPRQALDDEYAVVVPKFITSLMKKEAPPIYGDGSQTRDFTYVGNVVSANLKAATAARASGEVINVAVGSPHSVLELAQTLGRILGVSTKPKFLSKRTGDIPHSWADIRKARRLLGYRVDYSFREGLKETVDWFQKNRSLWDSR